MVRKKTRGHRPLRKGTPASVRSQRIVGVYRASPKGFGFVVPENTKDQGDIRISRTRSGTAMPGDRVAVQTRCRGKRRGKMVFSGEVVEILERAATTFVGNIQRDSDGWWLEPQGKRAAARIDLEHSNTQSYKIGAKVVVEIVEYSEGGAPPIGSVTQNLGQSGDFEAEARAVMHAFGIVESFSEQALKDASAAADRFNKQLKTGSNLKHRENLGKTTVITIDPESARDHDDAVSLERGANGETILGVHIADVAHFVAEGSVLDNEALSRGSSVYFPRWVVPMLPETLSAGVCSLREGEPRLAKSVFITYDASGDILGTRFAESLITVTRRLTYEQAQSMCDGSSDEMPEKIVRLVRNLEGLAHKIEDRRAEAGMLHLDLPEVRLVLDDNRRVIDAVPEKSDFSHKMIEMFMVEANDAVAGLFNELDVPLIRRLHPDPDEESLGQLSLLLRAFELTLSKKPTRQELQRLVDEVRGRPEEYAVNLAILRAFNQASYGIEPTGHYALASDNYCHFTSPIRRYPDLTVHRALSQYCRGKTAKGRRDNEKELSGAAEQCSETERRAESAEHELRLVLVLNHLQEKIGENFDGVITGITEQGIFIQSPRFLVEGLLRYQDLGDEWWDASSRYGLARGERTGTTYRIGDVLPVTISGVDIPKRFLNLSPV